MATSSSNGRISCHKARSTRGGGREARAKAKAEESRSAREALLLERRRIPLSEIQEEPENKKKGI